MFTRSSPTPPVVQRPPPTRRDGRSSLGCSPWRKAAAAAVAVAAVAVATVAAATRVAVATVAAAVAVATVAATRVAAATVAAIDAFAVRTTARVAVTPVAAIPRSNSFCFAAYNAAAGSSTIAVAAGRLWLG